MAELGRPGTDGKNQDAGKDAQEFQEITLKFGRGCVEGTFLARDGHEYAKILIPNSDPADHTPWATFVARANAVHEDRFGKGLWLKLPARGHTTIHKECLAGTFSDGRKKWETRRIRVTNLELKEMVEFYRNRTPESGRTSARESLKERLGEKKMEAQAAGMPQEKECGSKDIYH